MKQTRVSTQRQSKAALRAAAQTGASVTLQGMVHRLKDFGGVQFLMLRRGDGLFQCVLDEAPQGLVQECAVSVTGCLRIEPRAKEGFELAVDALEILSTPAAPMPIPVSKHKLKLNMDTALCLRPLALRNLEMRQVFQVQAELVKAFRAHLDEQGFLEIHSPKIVSAGAEGGSNIFRLDYFGQKAYLAQSPQFYKQMMVGVSERVYEVGPVFRAEKHGTTRHLAEYTSMDFEMGFISGMDDVMDMEEGFLRRLLPELPEIPRVRFDDIKRRAAEAYGYQIRDPYDLSPDEEQAIGRYAQEQWGSDFVFVTHYPSKKRPFYAMDDPEEGKYTLSFDLLCKGVEVTTGGQRIHDYHALVEKMERRGMELTEFEDYLSVFRHGMPPHGGLGLGLERLTMQLLGLDNVRQATLFPRDRSRLTP